MPSLGDWGRTGRSVRVSLQHNRISKWLGGREREGETDSVRNKDKETDRETEGGKQNQRERDDRGTDDRNTERQ